MRLLQPSAFITGLVATETQVPRMSSSDLACPAQGGLTHPDTVSS
jgi:hypothetical protein